MPWTDFVSDATTGSEIVARVSVSAFSAVCRVAALLDAELHVGPRAAP